MHPSFTPRAPRTARILAAITLATASWAEAPARADLPVGEAAQNTAEPAPTRAAAATLDPIPALRSLGCVPGHVLMAAERVFASCTGNEVWTLGFAAEGGLRLLERRRALEPVLQLFLRDGVPWLQLAQGRQVPLAALVGVVALAPVAPPSPPPAVLGGQVMSVQRTRALVSLGRRHGLASGDHVAVSVPVDEADELGPLSEELVIGRVGAVGEERAQVEFGFGEPVQAGSRVETTLRPVTAERVAPVRLGGVLHLEAALRPYLPIRHAGLGALAELALTYRAQVPLYFRVELAPLGGRLGSGNARGALGAFGSVGWDHSVFALGVGVGFLERRDYDHTIRRDGNVTIDTFDAYQKTVPSFAVSQFVRVGALDGLHATFTNVLAIAQSSDEWAFGSLLVRGQIPLSSTAWLRPSAGGGRGAGFVLGELGARVLVQGNGRSRSLFLTPSVGVTGIGTFPGASYVVGPMVGLSAEYRLGG